ILDDTAKNHSFGSGKKRAAFGLRCAPVCSRSWCPVPKSCGRRDGRSARVNESVENQASAQDAIRELRTFLGERVSTDPGVLSAHSKDVSHHRGGLPDAVVYPLTNDDTCRIARVCADRRVPIIPFGTGTAVEGGVVALCGGICVDLGRMDRILR